jgi:hypothetical protein
VAKKLVRSLLVVPLTPPSRRLAPAFSTKPKYSSGACSEPWNIRCSNRWAKPVRPGFSFFEPTWNHWLTLTIGSLRSTCRMTVSPFGSVYCSNSILGASAAGAGDPAAARASAAARARAVRFKAASTRIAGGEPGG